MTAEVNIEVDTSQAVANLEQLADRVEVDGEMMTRQEWRAFMHECPHEKFTHSGVKLMDGSRMSICDRCKYIQHEAIAKMIEGEER